MRLRPGPLAIRLAVVMVAVALLSVVTFGVIVYLVERSDVPHEVQVRQHDAVASLSGVATDAYQAAKGWSGANLGSLDALATEDQLGFRLTAADGAVVDEHPVPGPAAGTTTAELRSGSTVVGQLAITYSRAPLPPENRQLRQALSRSVFAAAGIAAAVAVAVALLVAARVTRPIKALTAAMRSRADGEPAEPPRAAPGELGELGRAFHAMTVDLDDAARLRRGMVADLAHELRTPIAVLQAETEALLDGIVELSPAAAASLHEEALRLGRLVEDLQTLSSAEAARLDLRTLPVDLADVVAAAVDGRSASAREAGVALQRDLRSVTVVADPLRLHQVATNLLTNAIKFTPAGGSLTLEAEGSGDGVEIRVIDQGVGIADEELQHLFEPFFTQLDPSRHSSGDLGFQKRGLGLGLSLVRRFLQMHGGTVRAESRPGQGTRMTIHLPRRGFPPAASPLESLRGLDGEASAPAPGDSRPGPESILRTSTPCLAGPRDADRLDRRGRASGQQTPGDGGPSAGLSD